MKMLQTASVGEDEMGGSGGGTVVVGVKLDSQSRELLTWALVKLAQPGDSVIALHVLGNNEIVDRDGKSSLLSLVKAFDSILAVYEGFCNLKQVDLKLKICRGSPIQKILVREANAYSATKVIVGAAAKQHKIKSPISIAKYCGKKLSKSCWVIAVSNGKVIYQREGSSASILFSEATEGHRKNGLFKAIHRTWTLTKNSKVLSEGNDTTVTKLSYSENCCENLGQALAKARLDSLVNVPKQNCSICRQGTAVPEDSFDQSERKSLNDDDSGDKSMALVPVQTTDAGSSSTSVLIKQLPEFKPGWPLLHRRILAERHVPDRFSLRKISVVHWVMRLPPRRTLYLTDSENEPISSGQDGDTSFDLNEETGAIVPVGSEAVTAPAYPENSSKSLPKELEGLHEKYSATCRLFNYQELLSATSNFLAENLIGKGGSSQVYRGCLPDGKELAVKILKPSEDVLKEFILEIEIINTLHHKNIISLLGFCYEDSNLLLVYDFLSRGSLDENLHGKKSTLEFGWNERYKVALGVAEALDYLHNHNEQPVIHRDIKSSNILLSDDFEPQLSDFGLATWASTSSSHVTCTDVAGTFGYLAPEYFMYGKVNDKIDVYAFGVVLLELLSGRKPISNDYPKGQESLVMWANPILSGGKVSQLLDPSLGNDYDCDQMERMVLAATLCIRRTPRTRPQISLILKLLEGDTEVTKWAKLQVTASEDSELLDDEACPRSNLQSHLNMALLDVEDDSLSVSSIEQCVSLEDYLQGRWSRSSSFD